MKLGEAFIALGFDVDESKLNEFSDKIKDLGEGMFKVAGVTAGALYAIDRFIGSVADQTVALRDLQVQTGLSEEAIQQWSNAAHIADTSFSTEQAQESIKSLQGALTELNYGGGNANAASLLIGNQSAMGMTAFQYLTALRQHYEEDLRKFGAAKTASLMSAMGIDPKMMLLLSQSQENFSAMMKSGGDLIISKQDIANINAAESALTQLEMRLKLVSAQFASFVSPYIIKAIDYLPTLIKNIDHAFQMMGTSTSEVVKWVGILSASFFLLLTPIGQAVAAVTGLAILLNEIGNGNLLHDLYSEFLKLAVFLEDHLFIPWAKFIDSFHKMSLGGLFGGIWNNMKQTFAYDTNGGLTKDLKTGIDSLVESIGKFNDDFDAQYQLEHPEIYGTPSSKVSNSKTNTVNQTNNINVHGNANARDTAAATADMLSTKLIWGAFDAASAGGKL